MATTMMADFPTNMPVFLTPSQQEHLNKLRMSASATGINNNWENDISAFLMNNTDQLDFSNVPSSSPIDNNDMGYYPNSSPETFVSPDASPYRSDNSQISSPFDPALFNNSPVQEIYSPPQMYTPPQPDMYNSSPHNEYSAPIDVDPSLFEACNLTNPLLMPEIEKILAATPAFQPTSSAPIEIPSIETASKKRAREFDFNANVTLSRDQLLAMSSKEIEDYVSVVKTKRTLTAAEEKDLKKQRRLVKNREYASQSRSRKKQYVDEIEKQLEQARAETDAYKKQNQMLIEENKILKKQLGHIAETIKKSQHGANMRQQQHVHPSNLVSSTPGMFTQFTTIGGGRHSMLPSKTASACVFVILFMVCTFATFWDNEPLGITLFPNQNNGGHIFNKRRLLEFELEDIVGLNPDFSPFSSLSSSHSHSDPNIQHKSNSSPDSSLPSSFSSSSSSSLSSSLSSSSSYSTNLCYPHVYDSSVNASAWCSQDEHNNIIIL